MRGLIEDELARTEDLQKMTATYDSWLVLLSIVVSITASFVALDLTSRVAASRLSNAAKYGRLAAGAVSMGSGIWSMHFIGMLGWRLPIPTSFDIPITLLSFVIAVAASWVALQTAGCGVLSTPRLIAGGLLMGAGIALMHYCGMSAMKMQPPLRYEPWLFSLSIAIAIGASMVALQYAFKLRMETIFSAFRKKAGSAMVMGGAIYGMHYTAMTAAIIAPNSICGANPHNIDNQILAMALGSLTLLFLFATLLISAFDAYRASHAETLALRSDRQLIAAIEEREQLSRDLHDNIVQTVYAIGMQLEHSRQLVRVNPDEVRAQLEQGIAGLNRVIRDVRRYIAGSQLPLPRERQLRTELEQLIATMRSAEAPHLQLDIDDTAIGHLTWKESEQFVSIAREALSNCLRYSRGQHATVVLRVVDDGVRLEIRDDGVGFDPQHPPQAGSGLHNIMARARQMGAKLEVLSSPGQGARIIVHIPKQP
jgi:NO-binding membrane sensor protein with MHYT domain/two-component sensor histidine kinase